MKTYLFLVIFLFYIQNIFCQTPTKTILYTCGPDEEFFMSEFCSNMRIDGPKFSCLIKNRKENNMSLVWNGDIIETAEIIWVWYINLNSKEGNIYETSNKISDDKYQCYFITSGKKHGPYDEVYFDSTDPYISQNLAAVCHRSSSYGSDIPESNNFKVTLLRNIFRFKTMGISYTHRFDGSIYNNNVQEKFNFLPPQIFTSTNGKYTAKIDFRGRIVEFNGSTYVLPLDLDRSFANFMCHVTNDGSCFMTANNPIIIKDDKVISFDEYYNGVCIYDEVEDKFIFYDTPTSKDFKGQFDNNPRMRSYFAQSMLPNIVQDKQYKHTLIYNWDTDYIMIDDNKILGSAIEAYYDEKNNAFGWVTIEDKSLVLYSYKL